MNSLIHVLLYSNEVDIQGIVQSSSKFHWKGVAGQKKKSTQTISLAWNRVDAEISECIPESISKFEET